MAALIATTVDGGGTGDYLTLFAAEADNFGATNANLVTGDEYCECSLICTDGAADATAVTIAGQTTDATHTITITVPDAYRHSGTFPASGNFYRRTATIFTDLLNGSFVGLAVKRTASGNTQDCISFNAVSQDNVTFDSCYLEIVTGAYTACKALWVKTASGKAVYVKNCVFVSGTTTSSAAFYDGDTSAGTVYLYNCTAAKSTIGYRRGGSTIVAKNNISFGNTTDWSGTYSALSTKNGYSNGTGPSGGSSAINLGTDSAVVFKDYANNDFHLRALGGVTNPAFRTGADLDEDANLAVTTDIDGELRHATTPCIGADEAHFWEGVGTINVPSVEILGNGAILRHGSGTITLDVPNIDGDGAINRSGSGEISLPLPGIGGVGVGPPAQVSDAKGAIVFMGKYMNRLTGKREPCVAWIRRK